MESKTCKEMESHVLNYHHARLHPVAYKTLRVKTDSLSSESSCNQYSPEYPQISVSGKRHFGRTSDWYIRNQSIASQSCQHTNSENDSNDEEHNMEESEVNKVHNFYLDDNMEERENMEVYDVNVEDEVDEEIETDNIYLNRSTSIDDHSLVEGYDYEVIAVYTVNPNSPLLESSSEDDGEEYDNEKDYSINDDNCTVYICQDEEDIKLEPSMTSNVDKYFVENDNSEQHIPKVEEPVVRNVDEYFLDIGNNVTVPNVDDFFIKHKLPEEETTQFQLNNSSNKVQHFLFTENNKPQEKDKVGSEPLRLETETNVVDISTNESDLGALPNIEDIKRYLIEDIPYTEFRRNQKSCSVPQSTMQNICIDDDDAETCLSLEDLNLDLLDLIYEIEKSSKPSCCNKINDVPRTLTDEDINSFICKYNNTDNAIVKQDEDDLSPQDMEIEATISSRPPMINPPSSRVTSLLNFCIEKTSKEDATKSEVILNCDYIDSQKDKTIEINCKNSDNMNTNSLEKKDKTIIKLGKNECSVVNTSSAVEEEPHSKSENSYTGLFSIKKELQMSKPLQPKTEKRSFDDELNKCMEVAIKKEQPPLKKKKLTLQEYKLRRGVSSNTSSTKVSPEAKFPDMPSPGLNKAVKCPIVQTTPYGLLNTAEKVNNEQKFFDPIKEAARKFLECRKRKAEAIRKRDEDIVMSKIPKYENFQLQPLISDAEMLKIIGMTKPQEMKLPIAKEKPRMPANYEEIILVSIGTNTNKDMFQKPATVYGKMTTTSPLTDSKSMLNFEMKKSDHVLRQNVFDIMKRENRPPMKQKKPDDLEINKERYIDITSALKSVKKQVDTKISSNSLFASFQDVVMKKAPEDVHKTNDERHLKSKSNLIDKFDLKCAKTPIVREYDSQAEHGEDKVIMHLRKHRSKPKTSNVLVQTDEILAAHSLIQDVPLTRKRNDSDMSLSSDGSHSRRKVIESQLVIRSREKIIQAKEVHPDKIERETKEKRSLSKDRYASKYRCRSRSTSRSCRRRSRSRSQSRSHCRYRRYRRSDSPYNRKPRSRSRSYQKRRSPSVRRDWPYISQSGSRPPRLANSLHKV